MFLLDLLPPSPVEMLFYGLSQMDITTAIAILGIALVIILAIIVIKKR